MTSVVDNLRDPSWWFTVVLAGSVMNIVGAFLYRRLDTYLASASSVWRARSALRQAERSDRISLLTSHAEFRQHWYFYELRSRLRSLTFLLQGLALGALALCSPNLGAISTIAILLSLVLLVFGLQSLQQAARAADELSEAVKLAATK